MIFGRKETEQEKTPIRRGSEFLLVGEGLPTLESFKDSLNGHRGRSRQSGNNFASDGGQETDLSSSKVDVCRAFADVPESLPVDTCYVISSLTEESALTALQRRLHEARSQRNDGLPVLIQKITEEALLPFGRFLQEMSATGRLDGVKLLVSVSPTAEEILSLCTPLDGSNVIRMPIAPEVPNSGYKYFYSFTPLLDNLVRMMGELAENNISRVYLLGAPGTGKTSLAYYFYTKRAKGNFVTVNLSSESTGDKAAMKSLLCGHVAGSIAGGGAREGALSFARDGVCFLDESHGVTGSVMQVLMEVLESNQFLPFGATAKRLLECAVVFASNRSWEALREMIHLDEHARLGAVIVGIPDLKKRREDRFAIAASVLATFAKKCTSWEAPVGCTPESWELIDSCQWRGNTRTLIRVMESACIEFALSRTQNGMLLPEQILSALKLWEPDEHPDNGLYTSY